MTVIEVRPNDRGGQHVFIDGVDVADRIISDGFAATVTGGRTEARVTYLYVNPDLTIEADDGIIYANRDRS